MTEFVNRPFFNDFQISTSSHLNFAFFSTCGRSLKLVSTLRDLYRFVEMISSPSFNLCHNHTGVSFSSHLCICSLNGMQLQLQMLARARSRKGWKSAKQKMFASFGRWEMLPFCLHREMFKSHKTSIVLDRDRWKYQTNKWLTNLGRLRTLRKRESAASHKPPVFFARNQGRTDLCKLLLQFNSEWSKIHGT